MTLGSEMQSKIEARYKQVLGQPPMPLAAIPEIMLTMCRHASLWRLEAGNHGLAAR